MFIQFDNILILHSTTTTSLHKMFRKFDTRSFKNCKSAKYKIQFSQYKSPKKIIWILHYKGGGVIIIEGLIVNSFFFKGGCINYLRECLFEGELNR